MKNGAANWNETDETSASYIKNKPFWKKDNYHALINSKELTFEEAVEVYNDEYLYKSTITNIPMPDWIWEKLFQTEWYIIWDGIEYRDMMYDPDYDYYTIGNDALINSWHDDTGEPFALMWKNKYADDEANTMFIFTTETSVNHTFEFGYCTLEK